MDLPGIWAVGVIPKLVFLGQTIINKVDLVVFTNHYIVKLYIEVEVTGRVETLDAINHLDTDLDRVLLA